MSNAARILQAIFWASVLFILTPSKLAAVAYAILIIGLLIAVIVALGIGRAIISAFKGIFRS